MLIHLKNNQLPIVYLFEDLKSSSAAPAGVSLHFAACFPQEGHLAAVGSDCPVHPCPWAACCHLPVFPAAAWRDPAQAPGTAGHELVMRCLFKAFAEDLVPVHAGMAACFCRCSSWPAPLFLCTPVTNQITLVMWPEFFTLCIFKASCSKAWKTSTFMMVSMPFFFFNNSNLPVAGIAQIERNYMGYLHYSTTS